MPVVAYKYFILIAIADIFYCDRLANLYLAIESIFNGYGISCRSCWAHCNCVGGSAAVRPEISVGRESFRYRCSKCYRWRAIAEVDGVWQLSLYSRRWRYSNISAIRCAGMVR